jgi:DNA polymerase III epsilon subunit-like protein
MNVIFIYCQTNGLHQTNETVIKKNLFEFARLVSLNYEIGIFEKKKFKSLKKIDVIIKPRCMFIDEDTIKIHGITNEIAKEKGIEIEEILKKFKDDLKDVEFIVTHNQNFHLKTIMAEFIRYNLPFSFEKFKKIDLMNFNHEIKPPKLNLLYNELINKSHSDQKKNEIDKIKELYILLR